MRCCIFAIVVGLTVGNPSHAAFTDFEDLVTETGYAIGSRIVSNGLRFDVVPYLVTSSTNVSVSATNYAGGTGRSLFAGYRVGLRLNWGRGSVDQISFRYGDYCCDLGMTINGVATTAAASFAGLDGTVIGGVTVGVTSSGGSNPRGIISLTGTINSFIVGGTELGIDDVTIISASPGDFDQDGDVDGRDFLRWQRGESTTPFSSSELTNWKSNYGVGSLQAVMNVPEPSNCNVILLGLLTVMGAFRTCAWPFA